MGIPLQDLPTLSVCRRIEKCKSNREDANA